MSVFPFTFGNVDKEEQSDDTMKRYGNLNVDIISFWKQGTMKQRSAELFFIFRNLILSWYVTEMRYGGKVGAAVIVAFEFIISCQF